MSDTMFMNIVALERVLAIVATHCITILKNGTYRHWIRWMHTVGDIIQSDNGRIVYL